MINERNLAQNINHLLPVGDKIGEGRENEVYEYTKDRVIKFPKLEELNSSEYLKSMQSTYSQLKPLLGECLPNIDFQRVRRMGKDYNAFIQRKISGKDIATIFRETPENNCIAIFLEDETRRKAFIDFFQKVRLASLRIGVPLDIAQDNLYLEESGNISLVDIGGIPIVKDILQSKAQKHSGLRKMVAESILKNLEEFQRWEQGLSALVDMAELNRIYGIDENEFRKFVDEIRRKANEIIAE